MYFDHVDDNLPMRRPEKTYPDRFILFENTEKEKDAVGQLEVDPSCAKLLRRWSIEVEGEMEPVLMLDVNGVVLNILAKDSLAQKYLQLKKDT